MPLILPFAATTLAEEIEIRHQITTRMLDMKGIF